MEPMIFVSYARPDATVVRVLVQFLHAAGFSTWFDEKDLRAGDEWGFVIQREISRASLFLLCLSSNSVNRYGFFQKEMRIALDFADTMPQGTVFIMPIRLDPCEVPARLQKWHVLDIFADDGSHNLLRSIGKALELGARAPYEAHAKLDLAIRACITGSQGSVRQEPNMNVPTGDRVIDQVLTDLESLKAAGTPIPEAKLITALTPLFARPAFYGIREENWHFFLYTLCRTRLILEEYIPHIRSSPQIRRALGTVIEMMVRLQNDVAKIYGPAFSITDHIHDFIHNKQAFTENLPMVVREPDYPFFDERDKTVREIRDILRPLGLTSW